MKALETSVGDRLPPSGPGHVLQTVKSISIDEGRVVIATDQETYYLRGDQELLFPRRIDGESVIWFGEDKPAWNEIPIEQLCVGDIVPDELGWVMNGEEPELTMALLITNIVFSSHGTYINLYSPTIQKVRRQYIPLGAHLLHQVGTQWEEYGQKSSASKATPKTSSTSGLYVNILTGGEASFRIKGRAGRPSAGSVPAPSHPSDWKNWVLKPGEKAHPDDPARGASNALES